MYIIQLKSLVQHVFMRTANEKTTIMNYNGTHGITFSKYDEFGMMISNTEVIKTSKTCEDLYKQFKKEMR